MLRCIALRPPNKRDDMERRLRATDVRFGVHERIEWMKARRQPLERLAAKHISGEKIQPGRQRLVRNAIEVLCQSSACGPAAAVIGFPYWK
jgi:hypothetical protein